MKWREEDEIAVELAAEARRHRAQQQAEYEARAAELPRVVHGDLREHWQRLKALGRRVLRAMLR